MGIFKKIFKKGGQGTKTKEHEQAPISSSSAALNETNNVSRDDISTEVVTLTGEGAGTPQPLTTAEAGGAAGGLAAANNSRINLSEQDAHLIADSFRATLSRGMVQGEKEDERENGTSIAEIEPELNQSSPAISTDVTPSVTAAIVPPTSLLPSRPPMQTVSSAQLPSAAPATPIPSNPPSSTSPAHTSSPTPEIVQLAEDTYPNVLPADSKLDESPRHVVQWRIKNWASFTQPSVTSPTFEAHGTRWQFLIYPRGNRQTQNLSVYIQNVDAMERKGEKWHQCCRYDSKEATGFVGLKNLGATGYLNIILQQMYCTNIARRAVFQIPTEKADPEKDVALALQRVFYRLQHSQDIVNPLELTKAFGWSSLDLHMPHDVFECLRVLQGNLEQKSKKTTEFCMGTESSYITCIKHNHKMSRDERFYDIALRTYGFSNLMQSFEEYVATELLDGMNQYWCQVHGLQDARKGRIFEKLPPVLQIQLQRFQYDVEKDRMVELRHRFEYPLTIELDRFMSAEADKSVRQKYILHSVIGFQGTMDGTDNQYMLYTRPYLSHPPTANSDRWFKFHDDRVTPALEREAVEGFYGSTDSTGRAVIAYGLQYIRESDISNVMAPITEADIPRHVREGIAADDAKMRIAREVWERNASKVLVEVLTNDDISKHQGFDLFDHWGDKGKRSRVDHFNRNNVHLKLFDFDIFDKFGKAKQTICSSLGTTVDKVRVWTIANRQNKTWRPDLIPADDVGVNSLFRKDSPAILYVEYLDASITVNPTNVPTSLLQTLFVKYYDATSKQLSFFGTVKVARSSNMSLLPDAIKRRWEWLEDMELAFCEEVKPNLIEEIRPNLTFQQAEIGDGDIITFCPSNVVQEMLQHYGDLLNVATIVFQPNRAGAEYALTLNVHSTCKRAMIRLAEELKVSDSTIRLTTEVGAVPSPTSRIGEVTGIKSEDFAYGEKGILRYELVEP
ncbi:hypothetical protein HDV00_006590 [Rhizophlyctis rosea]|nr:hypothetical protein HDV00_006590 [Rhizophlyctis rosea]